MSQIHSPWIHQLNKERALSKLTQDHSTDTVVVGAGIAGISTAFFLLKYTTSKVTILEGYKLAHGATGHNAGQVASYFERPFFDIVEEFGLDLAAQGQASVEHAWELLDEMYTEAGLTIPFTRFQGHLGISAKEQLITHLKNNTLRKKAQLKTEEILVSNKAEFIGELVVEYGELFSVVPHEQICERLETENTDFIATISFPKGCLNSALFCERVMEYLLEKYKQRFSFFEYTTVQKIALHTSNVVLDAGEHTITTDKVILCTNGFENLTILNNTGLDIDFKFHHNVKGTIGYMSGYLEKYNKPPTAISYFGSTPIKGDDDPYFYLTRRSYEYEQGVEHNLICVGGPDLSLDNSKEYLRESEYPEEAQKEIDNFIHTTYDRTPNKEIDYKFTWHGLMGYTPNRIRLIGAEPKNERLLYNLGCNGVGILPSIFGGKRISQIVAGESLPKSIFDPRS